MKPLPYDVIELRSSERRANKEAFAVNCLAERITPLSSEMGRRRQVFNRPNPLPRSYFGSENGIRSRKGFTFGSIATGVEGFPKMGPNPARDSSVGTVETPVSPTNSRMAS